MFCLDSDVYFECGHCRQASVIDAECFGIKETPTLTSISNNIFQCPKCEGGVGLGWSLQAFPPQHDGFRGFGYRITPVMMRLLDEVKIIYDPFFVSKIGNLSPYDYQITLDQIESLKQDFSLIHTLDRFDFEALTAELIRRKGFEVELTKKTRDGGVDIIGVTNLNGIPFKLFVQCKRNDPGNPVRVDVVRSLYGVHSGHNGPNKSIIVSNTYFTKDAQVFAQNGANSAWELSLYDFEDIRRWLYSSAVGYQPII